jgi:hypothetical protein
MFALQPRKRFAEGTVPIVDGTLVPARDHVQELPVPTNHQVALFRGPSWQKQEVEELIEAVGWRLISIPPDEDFPADGQDHSGSYAIGILIRIRSGSERWDLRKALQQVESLADSRGVTPTPYDTPPPLPLLAPAPPADSERQHEREVRPKWYGCEAASTDHRRLRRWALDTARKWGLRDTGEILAGPLDWARAHVGAPASGRPMAATRNDTTGGDGCPPPRSVGFGPGR